VGKGPIATPVFLAISHSDDHAETSRSAIPGPREIYSIATVQCGQAHDQAATATESRTLALGFSRRGRAFARRWALLVGSLDSQLARPTAEPS
jgi:hypothetical protein